MHVAIINDQGRDPDQLFPDGAGPRDAAGHAPVNYHAYAACTRAGFFQSVAHVPKDTRCAVVLLRRDLRPALQSVGTLQSTGCTVAISWKESGPFQIADQLATPGAQDLFRTLCARADAALASTPEAEPFYREAGAKVVEYVPTPYPVDDPRWDFSRPLAGRSGIFIGTREWSVSSRRHEQAVREAVALGVPVTVVNEGNWFQGWRNRRRLRAMGVAPERILRRMPYTEYLATMARSRVVYQCDASAVPGQIAGDALLCRMPCVGGNGAIEREAFADLPDAATLLRDDAAWHAAVAQSQQRAQERVSFAAVADRLQKFFTRLGA